MNTLSIQRNKSICLLFLATVLLSGLFTFISLFEFVEVGMRGQTSGYPFGEEGPTPWYYHTPQLYATVNLIFGLLYFLPFTFCCWAFIKVKKASLLVSLIVTLLLILLELVNGQSS